MSDGGERFTHLRRLGEGSFGVVWQVLDRDRQATVALKILTRSEPLALYHFKREFRELAGLVHPNLVTLYELFQLDDGWSFTMEYVDGVDFVQAVRPPAALPVLIDDATATTVVHLDRSTARSVGRSPAGPAAPPADLDRLRDLLFQLAVGLDALHVAGKIHCDVKPSNVLVTDAGQLKLLDFGLVTGIATAASGRYIAGTPAFMAPEQSAGAPLTPAVDWYAVGMMLHVALTGQRPLDDTLDRVLGSRQVWEAEPPSALVEGLPRDLDRLCVELMRRDPKARPSGDEVIDRLRPRSPRAGRPMLERTPRFVGRQAQLDVLKQAAERHRVGHPVAALVHGASGLGKTTLVRHFLSEVAMRSPPPVLLTGRCFERETVPYKGLDDLIDDLATQLQACDPATVAAILPPEIEALAQLFPVLRKVDAIARPRAPVAGVVDRHERRRLAFRALRDLLAAWATIRPITIFLDDLQWSDPDGGALLTELLRPPTPPLFLIAAFRSADVAGVPLRAALADWDPRDVHELEVSELLSAEAETLALALLGPDDAARARLIARESAGSPLFLGALVRTAAVTIPKPTVSEPVPSTFAAMVRGQVELLPAPARAVLEMSAIAEGPLDLAIIANAVGSAAHDPQVRAVLMAAHLVRTAPVHQRDHLDCYHDRIRQAVLSQLSDAELAVRHAALAWSLEATGTADAELLARHHDAAGHHVRASHYLEIAANDASEALAFDREARLYRMLLARRGAPDGALRARLGAALTQAGRGAEAAEAFLDAAALTAGISAHELRRRAAEGLMLSGHPERAMKTILMVVDALGLRVPRSQGAVAASLLLRRAQLRLRGLHFEERAGADIPAADLMRVDTCWTISTGMSLVNPALSAAFQSQQMLFALRAGDPVRVARALALEVAHNSAGGSKNSARTAAVIGAARRVAERTAQPYALGLCDAMTGVARYMEGRFIEAVCLTRRGSELLRTRCTGVPYGQSVAEVFCAASLWRMGRWREMAEQTRGILADAASRGDRWAATYAMLFHGSNIALMQDDVARARQGIDDALLQVRHNSFDVRHFMHAAAATNILLYEGRVEAGLAHILAQRPALRRAFMFGIQQLRFEFHDAVARAALGAAMAARHRQQDRRHHLDTAAKSIAALEQEPVATIRSVAQLRRAEWTLACGRHHDAGRLLLAAERALDAASMSLHATVARRIRGTLNDTADGAALIADADAWLRGQGIAAPATLARMVAPLAALAPR